MLESKKIFKFFADVLKSEEKDKDSDFYVEAYASTTGLDRQGDIILTTALEEAATDLASINSTAFYGHNYDLKNAIGKVVDAEVDNIGLKLKIYISSLATELRTKIREGIISKLSIGGRVIDDETITKDEAVKRGLVKEDCPFDLIHIIKKLELYEVSFVGVPANPEAQVLQTLSKALEDLYRGGENMKKKIDKEEIDEKKEQETQKEEDNLETKEEEQIQKENETESKEEVTQKEEEQQKQAETESDEVTEEEIKDLLEEEEEVEEKKGKETYYYYYGKDIKEKLDKLGEAVAGISKKLDDLIKLIKEKVKTVEVIAEKKSIIKKEDVKKEVKKKEEDTVDPDEQFLKFLKKKK